MSNGAKNIDLLIRNPFALGSASRSIAYCGNPVKTVRTEPILAWYRTIASGPRTCIIVMMMVQRLLGGVLRYKLCPNVCLDSLVMAAVFRAAWHSVRYGRS